MSARVYFAVDDGESAIRIEAVLGALGFEPVRDLCVVDEGLVEEVRRHFQRRGEHWQQAFAERFQPGSVSLDRFPEAGQHGFGRPGVELPD